MLLASLAAVGTIRHAPCRGTVHVGRMCLFIDEPFDSATVGATCTDNHHRHVSLLTCFDQQTGGPGLVALDAHTVVLSPPATRRRLASELSTQAPFLPQYQVDVETSGVVYAAPGAATLDVRTMIRFSSYTRAKAALETLGGAEDIAAALSVSAPTLRLGSE